MPLVNCPECKKEISDSAPSCPHCGKVQSSNNPKFMKFAKRLFIGSFSFLALVVILVAISPPEEEATEVSASAETATQSKPEAKPSKPTKEEKIYNDASFAKTDSEVGCTSKYSDDKKEDIFNSSYKNQWFTWRGVIVLAESDSVSIDVNGGGGQDLSVDFADPKAGYDLTVGSVITVEFLMESDGGCFLPFGGDKAVLVK